MKSPYLVCYDIADEKRLNRMYKYMKGKGFHIQYSVFYCIMSEKEIIKLKEEVLKIINLRYDDVRIYPLSQESLVSVLGVGDRIPEGVEVFIDY